MKRHWVYHMLELREKYKERDKVWSMRDTLSALRYIAKSPAAEHGGFHEHTIMTAKSALHHIARIKKQTNHEISGKE